MVGRSAAGALYRREDLAEGTSVTGPAAVGEYSGTTWVPEGWRATALGAGMLLERAGA
jgi:N-methylhydantoinase A/oxoprolinase/acetone carboxylase beta subunit